MYRAKSGFTLRDSESGYGWQIRNAQDIFTALEGRPEFATVAEPFLIEAAGQAIDDRKEYADITEFAQFIAENYL